MSHPQNITDVRVVGATGTIGGLAVAAAQRHGLRPRALVRDTRRAERLLPGVDLVRGDLEDPASLRAAVQGVDAMVLASGSGGHSRPDARVPDPGDLPVEAEPRTLRADLDTVRSLRGFGA